MKRAVLAGILSMCICLSGCGVLQGRDYVWQESRPLPSAPAEVRPLSAGNAEQLRAVLTTLVESGTVQATVSVARYDQTALEAELQQTMETLQREHPIAAYAVESVRCTPGTMGGERVVAVEIQYLHGKAEIQKIVRVADMQAAEVAIHEALDACEPELVLLVEQYSQRDMTQLVEDYALGNPHLVMEMPRVTACAYPEEGESRVLAMQFTYQTSREILKQMRRQVEDLFQSARFFITGYRTDEQRFNRLYIWLMQTNEHTEQTSITPAYSLLQYGIGDSRAYATVYTALCRKSNLTCMTVSGTKNGESRYWNLVCVDGMYYHLDLLQCNADGGFALRTDGQMTDYVWDYDAYPSSPDPEPIEPTEPTAPTEPTVPAPTEPAA